MIDDENEDATSKNSKEDRASHKDHSDTFPDVDFKDEGFIGLFLRHRIAANVLMILIFLCGLWAVFYLNVQFLPSFNLKIVNISVAWPGASPKDVEQSITTPLELALKNVSDVKKVTSLSSYGSSRIVIEFRQSAVMSQKLNEINNKVDSIRTLPVDSRTPRVSKIIPYERVARIVVTSNDDASSLRHYALLFKQELLNSGISSISVFGLADKQLEIQLNSLDLARLNKSLPTIGAYIGDQSKNLSAGKIGRNHISRNLRTQQQERSIRGFEDLPILTGDPELMTYIGNVADVNFRTNDYPRHQFYKGKHAVTLLLYRHGDQDALASAKILQRWKDQTIKQLPKGMKIKVYEQWWQMIRDRIYMLLFNGLTGFGFIIVLLFLFLNFRTAFWVAVGIPISIAAALFLLKMFSGTINMISLFALIMTLGIIVDDTIVVSEQAVTEFEGGKTPYQAVLDGSRRMLAPIFASSLTTIAAFIPLMILGGVMGKLLISIPIVVVCVILASLIECFWILPTHIKNSLTKINRDNPYKLRLWFNKAYDFLKYSIFRRLLTWAIKFHWITLSLAVASFLIAISIPLGKHINFNFFPSPPGRIIYFDADFHAGTPSSKIKSIMFQIEKSAYQTEKSLTDGKEKIITTAVISMHYANGQYRIQTRSVDGLASMIVELTPNENRDISNKQFIMAWKKNMPMFKEIENTKITEPKSGPSGSDIDIALYGNSPQQLKRAAAALKYKLQQYQGVYSIYDNLPYSQDDIVFKLKPDAKTLGLNAENVARQLQAAYDGYLIQTHYVDEQEIEVRLRLDDLSTGYVSSLEHIPIVLPTGETLPFYALADINHQKSFGVLQHLDRILTVSVNAEVDSNQANSYQIIGSLMRSFLPQMSKQYDVKYTFKGLSRDQSQTISEMKYAMVLAILIIYIILAWALESYIWPLFVMCAIPFGIEGAIFGHFIMRQDLTILSYFGFIGLSGIVVNDSIILIYRYLELLKTNLSHQEAIIEASMQRFRAVILTSVTTILGLLPLLYESSLQAQFLKPMVISITFGLAYATFLILIMIPAALDAYQTIVHRLSPLVNYLRSIHWLGWLRWFRSNK